MAEQQQAATLQQLNVEHFNKHGAEVKPHMLALAESTAQHILQLIPLGQDSTVLEFGCGLGLISERLAPAVGSVHGVDIAPKTIEAFNAKAAAKGLTNMRAVCVDLVNATERQQAIASGQLPASFSLIIAHMVLHHVEDAAAVLGCLAGLLQQGGRLVLTDLLQTERSKAFHGATAHHTVSHAGGFSEQQVSQLLAAAGLRLASFSGDSLHVTKAVAQPGGGEAPEAFPVFVAVGQAAADLR
uniref:Methyltransferase domain-containing protein n=1 Tax=Tetradesmus obliquus TaxID=3088 RepID=A0A383V5J2_TETOB|eukprot:jgi/Sobl393_1/13655/SZX60371.1